MGESLFQISTGLTRLMAQREDLLAEFAKAKSVDDQVRLGNAIEALELQIKEEAEPRELEKVDNVRNYLLMCDMMESAAEEEEKRQAAHKRHWKATSDFLKRCVMQTLEATGKTRLQGKHGYLRSQVNSAAPAPVISQPDLVPDELVVWEAGFTNREMLKIYDAIRDKWDGTTAETFKRLLKRVPSLALIKAELEANRAVAGCSLPEKGRHVRVA